MHFLLPQQLPGQFNRGAAILLKLCLKTARIIRKIFFSRDVGIIVDEHRIAIKNKNKLFLIKKKEMFSTFNIFEISYKIKLR